MSSGDRVVSLLVVFLLGACVPKVAGDRRSESGSPIRSPQSDGRAEDRPANIGSDSNTDEDPIAVTRDGSFALAQIHLAQTHVLPMSSKYLRLVAGRETLIKVNLVAASAESQAPVVSVTAKVGDVEETFALTGPAIMPQSLDKTKQSFADSFVVLLPEKWIQPGLSLQVRAGELTTEVKPLIGAPNPLHLTLLPLNIFKSNNPPKEPQDWPAEFQAKLPISSLVIERRDPILLTEVVVPPRGDVNLPAVRVRSQQQYREKTGKNFDGEQGLALGITNAIQVAAGDNRLSVYYAHVAGVGVGGGLADSFTGMGIAGNLAVFFHEFGHTLSLGHWKNNPKFPYQSDLDGIKGDPGHVGTTWGFDARQNTVVGEIQLPYFIPPTVQTNSVGREVGVYKKDPMAGGGSGDQEKGFHFRMFSDFSNYQMQNFLEKELVIWDESKKSFAKWDDDNKRYAAIKNNGVDLPIERQVSVYTVLYGVSAVTPEANFVYTPIGPYSSGMIRLFNADKLMDRESSQALLCKPRCDFTLRLTQNGQTTNYIVRGIWRPDTNPLSKDSYFVGALNVPSRLGPITAADLILTPNVAVAGLEPSQIILFQYRAP